jgi:hypothetical protein
MSITKQTNSTPTTSCTQTPGVFVKLLGSFRSTFCCPKTDYPYSRIFPYSLQTNIPLGKVKATLSLSLTLRHEDTLKGCGSTTQCVLNLGSRRSDWLASNSGPLPSSKEQGKKLVGPTPNLNMRTKINPVSAGIQTPVVELGRESTLRAVNVFLYLIEVISLRTIMVQLY